MIMTPWHSTAGLELEHLVKGVEADDDHIHDVWLLTPVACYGMIV